MLASVIAVFEHMFEHQFDLWVEIAVSCHILGLADRISDFKVCFHEGRSFEMIVYFFVVDVFSIQIENINPVDFLIEFVAIKI